MANSIIANTPDQHGFIMAGTNILYICHLPMFSTQNHMYQITLEVAIPDYAKSQYLKDKILNPASFYVLGNIQGDLFTIPDLMLGKRQSFVADIFRGMPEDPNKDEALIHNVPTLVKRVVYARHFDFGITYPSDLSYVVFGNSQEAFLDHYMTKEEDFMNLVELTEVPNWLPADQLAISSNLGFVNYSNVPTPLKTPLMQGTYEVNFQGQPESYALQVGKSFYFDTAILNMPLIQEKVAILR
jgi:hypothetical protein